MKSLKLLTLAFAVGLLGLTADAVVVPGTPNGGEPELHTIYNNIYGTSYTSANDPNFLATQTGWETITLDPDVESISFDALWRQAYLTDTIGYYTPSQAKLAMNMTDVMGPFDNSDPNVGQGPITMDPITVDVTGLGEIGFYDHAALPTDSSVFFNWFSESSLNDGQFQTTPDEIHVLILTTPFEDTYLLCFEDLPYEYLVDGEAKQQDIGDRDYQDVLVQITLNRTVVPEPSSIALLGIGLASVAYRRFKKIS
jgi:hypothetical protein